MQHPFSNGLVWLRRDLRLQDNPALALALRQCDRVHCAFVLDTAILDGLPRQDRRVEFILDSLRNWMGRCARLHRIPMPA